MAIALIVAAGKGKRMGLKKPKLLLPVFGKPILYYTVSAFYDSPSINTVIIAVNKEIHRETKKMVQAYFSAKKDRVHIIQGGTTRPETVLNGIQFCKKHLTFNDNTVITIHNGANPLVTDDEITSCINEAKKHHACIVAHPVTATLKEVNKKSVIQTHNRDEFAHAQTPQCFTYKHLIKALEKVGPPYSDMTDEAHLMEAAGYTVHHIPASEQNIKMTTEKDYSYIRHVLGDLPDDYLIGLGQDSHAFDNKKGLTLGGVFIEDEFALQANSDGDVIIHALCNALLQALGKKSLGAFADRWCEKKNIKDSTKYLTKIVRMVHKKGYVINNIGIMIEAKKPNMDPLSNSMKKNIAKLCKIDINRVGINATSGEELTAFGKGKGIQVYSIVTVKKNEA